MNRPRNRGNRDLPLNLYADRRGQKVYFFYKHPKTGKRHGMGADRTQAILAAQQLNTLLVSETSLVDQVLGQTKTFGEWLKKYAKLREDDDLADKTKKQLKYDINTMNERLGTLPVNDISVYHCAAFLDSWVAEGKNRMAARMRAQLIKCFTYAVANGFTDDNPAAKTLPIDVKVQRERLTKKQFDTIYSLASPQIQNAMRIALITLQRREDIASMKFSDIRDGYLYVAQSKTAKNKRGDRKSSLNQAAHLRIKVTPSLSAAIRECRSTNILSKYLIHHLHSRTSSGATHIEVKKGMSLQPDNLSRGFARARDKSGLFDHLTAKQKPGFHEIRSLGAHLYREMGIDPQTLLGHTDQKMTQRYLDGHGIEWTEVEAGLAI